MVLSFWEVTFLHSEEKLKQISIPFVLSTIKLEEEDGRQEYASISVDDIKESERIVEYLLQNGHRKIAVIGSRKDDESIGWLRQQGYRRALERYHVAVDEELICYVPGNLEPYSMEAGYEMTDQLLKKGKAFTALSPCLTAWRWEPAKRFWIMAAAFRISIQ